MTEMEARLYEAKLRRLRSQYPVVGVSIMHGAENRTEHRSVMVENGLLNGSWLSGREVE